MKSDLGGSRQVSKAVILCGGEGTRLRPFSFSTPKHLMPVANRPVIDWIFDTLAEAGVEDVAVVVSPLNERIFRRELGDKTRQGMSLSFVVQEEPKGLAHAVACARDFVGDDSFLLYLGDNLFELGVVEMVQGFKSCACAASIALTEVPDPSRFGVARLDGNRIEELIEKPSDPPSNWAVAGAYVFSPQIFAAIDQITPSKRGELEITDAIQVLIESQAGVAAHFVDGWWKDVGLPQDLILASELLMKRSVPRIDGHVDATSIVDGSVIVEEGAIVSGSKLRGPCVVGRDARIANSVIGPNVAVGDGCRIDESHIESSILMNEVSVKDVGLLCDSIVGRRSRLGSVARTECHTTLVGDDSFVSLRQ